MLLGTVNLKTLLKLRQKRLYLTAVFQNHLSSLGGIEIVEYLLAKHLFSAVNKYPTAERAVELFGTGQVGTRSAAVFTGASVRRKKAMPSVKVHKYGHVRHGEPLGSNARVIAVYYPTVVCGNEGAHYLRLFVCRALLPIAVKMGVVEMQHGNSCNFTQLARQR